MEHVAVTIVAIILVGAFAYQFLYKPYAAKRKAAGLRKPVDDVRRPR